MSKNIFNVNEMENIFEIGRFIQRMIDSERINVEDSKEAFTFALHLAMEFEKEYPDTEDYYSDIEEFIAEKVIDVFGEEE